MQSLAQTVHTLRVGFNSARRTGEREAAVEALRDLLFWGCCLVSGGTLLACAASGWMRICGL